METKEKCKCKNLEMECGEKVALGFFVCLFIAWMGWTTISINGTSDEARKIACEIVSNHSSDTLPSYYGSEIHEITVRLANLEGSHDALLAHLNLSSEKTLADTWSVKKVK